jgi:hypothetical protein
MKKVIGVLGFAMVVLSVSTVRAQGSTTYGMAGCGLGSMLFGQDNSKLMQILAATTNGTVGNQTFGITSGTSNCVESGVVKAEREQAAFAEVNFTDLKRNMASGGGEFLASFSTLLGCEERAKPVFFRMTQERYETILPTEKTSPIEMLVSVKRELKASPALAASCSDERAIARATGGKSPAKTDLALASSPVKAAASK